jgi:hypothetical protein
MNLIGRACALGLILSGAVGVAAVAPSAEAQDESSNFLETRTAVNWNGSGQTVCEVFNSSLRPITAEYIVFPISPDIMRPGRALVDIPPWQWNKVIAWANDQNPPPRCTFRSSSFR